MEIKSNVEIHEILDFEKDLIKHSKYHKKMRRTQFVVGLIFVAFVCYLNDVSFSYYASAFIFTTLIFPIIYIEANMMKAKSVIQKQNLSSFIGEQKMVINEEGIIKENENAKRKFKWESFIIVREDKRSYYLYISDTQGIIIRKNSLKDKEDEFKVYYDKYLSKLPKK